MKYFNQNNKTLVVVFCYNVEKHINTLLNKIKKKEFFQFNFLFIEDNSNDRTKNILLKYNEKLSNFRCGRCNFKTKTFFWQCPACYEWESINPNNSEA